MCIATTCSYFVVSRAKQVARCSFTRPRDCIAAYMVVGPTNLKPRFSNSLDSATDSGEVAGISESVRGARFGFLGANDQMSVDNESSSS